MISTSIDGRRAFQLLKYNNTYTWYWVKARTAHHTGLANLSLSAALDAIGHLQGAVADGAGVALPFDPDGDLVLSVNWSREEAALYPHLTGNDEADLLEAEGAAQLEQAIRSLLEDLGELEAAPKANAPLVVDLTAGELDDEGEKIVDGSYSFFLQQPDTYVEFDMWTNSEGYRVLLMGRDDKKEDLRVRIDLTTEEVQELCIAIAGLDRDGFVDDSLITIIDDEGQAIRGVCTVTIEDGKALERHSMSFDMTIDALRLMVACYYTERAKPKR